MKLIETDIVNASPYQCKCTDLVDIVQSLVLGRYSVHMAEMKCVYETKRTEIIQSLSEQSRVLTCCGDPVVLDLFVSPSQHELVAEFLTSAMAHVQPALKKDDDIDDDCKPLFPSTIRARSDPKRARSDGGRRVRGRVFESHK